MIKWLTDDFAVAPQLSAANVDEIVAMGFKSIMCNRPDGEAADQPGFSEIETAAKAAGLKTDFVPVISGRATYDDVEKFAAALRDLPKPCLAYCRSGTRSMNIWMAAQTLANQT